VGGTPPHDRGGLLGPQPLLASILVFPFWAMMKTTASVERRQRLQRQGNQPTAGNSVRQTRARAKGFCHSPSSAVPCHGLASGVSRAWPGKSRLEKRHETWNSWRQDAQTRAVFSCCTTHVWILFGSWITGASAGMVGWHLSNNRIAYRKTARLYMRFLCRPPSRLYRSEREGTHPISYLLCVSVTIFVS
jgi:hypothetical protein